ncbi:transcriptional repressor [Pseudoclavibacter chungangensis]|uniref:Transcriptional repressor n=1 Tax=Pseudoclavibacter chungangensis TaxID=587635 RepID=A0A7J5C230_9MICO|nr:Fur family transcriptional regulator [Pseudoclavibacter chungangensis]KAB1662230.1 transcriptional repressor [Pseudoclavibacter chungangensis]NYJ65433.1 Fur family ferric uptake transcriptional regulator [Pseudoclavibacter chungangensis]
MPTTETAPTGHDWAPLLRAHGLRVTKQRLAVLGALDGTPHASAEAVHAAAQSAGLAGLTLQAVYLILADLTRAGLARRVDAPRQSARYETRVGDNHHHIVCEVCGRIEDVDCVVGEAPCLEPADARGFVVHRAEITFSGVCAECLARPEPEPPTPPAA